ARGALVAGFVVVRGRGLSGAYFAIVTLAAAVIAERAASHSRFIGGFNGLLDVPPLRYGGNASRVELLAPMPVYYVMLGAAGLADGLLLWLERSPLGPTLPAGRDNEPRTPYLGFRASGDQTFNFPLRGASRGCRDARWRRRRPVGWRDRPSLHGKRSARWKAEGEADGQDRVRRRDVARARSRLLPGGVRPHRSTEGRGVHGRDREARRDLPGAAPRRADRRRRRPPQRVFLQRGARNLRPDRPLRP